MRAVCPCTPRKKQPGQRSRALLWTVSVGVLVLAACSDDTGFQGRPAPGFMLYDLSGNRFYLNDQRGKTVMLNFWSTWCTPCIREMPMLDSLRRDFQDANFILAGICTDISDKHYAASFAAGLDITFPLLMDEQGTVARAYGVNELPTTFIIDTAGIVRMHEVGYTSASEQQYRSALAQLCRERNEP